MLAYTHHSQTYGPQNLLLDILNQDYTYVHVHIGYLSNFCTSHILSFVITVELLLVEVGIVIGRLRAASRRNGVGWGFRKMCSEQKSAFKPWISGIIKA